MLSYALFYVLAVVCSVRKAHAVPLYAGTNSVPQEDVIQLLEAEGQDRESADSADRRVLKDISPYLLPQGGAREPWAKGIKDPLQQEKISNMVEYMKAAILKLAAADSLRSQGFVRADQSSPKTNKRACFWKYCVTN